MVYKWASKGSPLNVADSFERCCLWLLPNGSMSWQGSEKLKQSLKGYSEICHAC